MKYGLLITSLLVSILIRAQPFKIFESDTIFKAPESVVFDSINALLYISNYTKSLKNGDSYGQHSISKLDIKGNIIEEQWIKGLSSPTGIYIQGRNLYIVERFGVVVYDLERNKISDKYYIKTEGFLNDVCLDPEGRIYVTVSGKNQVYRIVDGIVELWLEHDSIDNPNGIVYHNGKLLIGTTSDGCIKTIHPDTKEVKKMAYIGEHIVDGIRPCGEGYLVSIFEGNLVYLSRDGEVSELLNTREEKTFIADFEYIESMGLIIIPALWNNKILIYKYFPGQSTENLVN